LKALVTGGAGFIGSHLVDALLKKGLEVIVLDNFATGQQQNLAQHAQDPRLSIVQVDIRDAVVLAPHFIAVDWVFHLAALADIVPSIENPTDYYTTNVAGTQNVLEASRKANIKRFIYVASSSSFGIADEYPTPETAAIRCEYPYALTKYLGELTALHWFKTYNMHGNVIKFFNIYGPRARTNGTYGAVFGVFLAQLANNQPITIVGDGTQTRDFTFVTDAVDALITAADTDVSGEVFNVGSGGTYSINHLADLLGAEREYIPKRPGEPDSTHADISKIQRVLRWEPKISFGEGVQCMLESMAAWKEAPVWTKDSIQEATKDWFQYLGTKD
jgi:UDP-glucose 4-epimerase